MSKTEYIDIISGELAALLTELHTVDNNLLRDLAKATFELRAMVQHSTRNLTSDELNVLEESKKDFAEGRSMTLDEAFDSIEKEILG